MSQVVAAFFQDEVIAVISIISNIMVKNKIENLKVSLLNQNILKRLEYMDDTIADEIQLRKSSLMNLLI